MDFAMAIEVNQGVAGDTAKLIMRRLIARQIRRDPALVEKAKIAHARQADQFAGWPFVREWEEVAVAAAGRTHFEADQSRSRVDKAPKFVPPSIFAKASTSGTTKCESAWAVRREGSRNEAWRAI